MKIRMVNALDGLGSVVSREEARRSWIRLGLEYLALSSFSAPNYDLQKVHRKSFQLLWNANSSWLRSTVDGRPELAPTLPTTGMMDPTTEAALQVFAADAAEAKEIDPEVDGVLIDRFTMLQTQAEIHSTLNTLTTTGVLFGQRVGETGVTAGTSRARAQLARQFPWWAILAVAVGAAVAGTAIVWAFVKRSKRGRARR